MVELGIIHIYTTDADVIACGTEILLYTTLTYFLCGIMDLIPGALRGMGHSAVPMILSIIGTVGTRIFWIYGVFPTHRSLMVLFFILSGLLAGNDPAAGDMFLFCQKESTQHHAAGRTIISGRFSGVEVPG